MATASLVASLGLHSLRIKHVCFVVVSVPVIKNYHHATALRSDGNGILHHPVARSLRQSVLVCYATHVLNFEKCLSAVLVTIFQNKVPFCHRLGYFVNFFLRDVCVFSRWHHDMRNAVPRALSLNLGEDVKYFI